MQSRDSRNTCQKEISVSVHSVNSEAAAVGWGLGEEEDADTFVIHTYLNKEFTVPSPKVGNLDK